MMEDDRREIGKYYGAGKEIRVHLCNFWKWSRVMVSFLCGGKGIAGIFYHLCFTYFSREEDLRVRDG